MLNCTTQFHLLLLPHSVSGAKANSDGIYSRISTLLETGWTQFPLGRDGGGAARNKGCSVTRKAVINVGSCFQFSPPMRKGREKERLLVTW